MTETENIQVNEEETAEIQSPSILPNSGSLLVREDTSRFSGAVWYEAVQSKTITLAGVGGIGSYVGFLLARLRPGMIYVYDPDRVETVNMSGQLYCVGDIEQDKVRALGNMVSQYANYYNMVEIPERFDNNSAATNIMICGFDNMAARKLFYSKWENHVKSKPEEERSKCLFIDGRLAAEEFQVFAILGSDLHSMLEYRTRWLFSDEEADATVCSYKQTSFMACMIASMIVNLFVNFVTGEVEGAFARPLPFMTSYEAETVNFKTEMR